MEERGVGVNYGQTVVRVREAVKEVDEEAKEKEGGWVFEVESRDVRTGVVTVRRTSTSSSLSSIYLPCRLGSTDSGLTFLLLMFDRKRRHLPRRQSQNATHPLPPHPRIPPAHNPLLSLRNLHRHPPLLSHLFTSLPHLTSLFFSQRSSADDDSAAESCGGGVWTVGDGGVVGFACEIERD